MNLAHYWRAAGNFCGLPVTGVPHGFCDPRVCAQASFGPDRLIRFPAGLAIGRESIVITDGFF